VSASHNDADAAFGAARVSPQRREIISAVQELAGAFTVEDLGRATHARDAHIGTATVYRAVAALEESGWLERVGERDGSTLFARCDAGRVEVTECPVVISAAENPDGFRITRHEVTLYGLCPACAASGKGAV